MKEPATTAESRSLSETPIETQSLSLTFVLAVVTAYAAVVFLSFLGDSRLLTRHEVMQAQPALTILQSGDWLVPQMLDQPWIHKPPLAIWMTAALYHTFGGFSETLTRIPSAISSIVICLLVTLLADRYFGRRAALLAGLAQATCVYMFIQGRLGEVDMPFAMFIVAALVTLAWHWGDGDCKLPIGAAALFHLMAGLAILTKGPLAIALIGMPILCFAAMERSMKPIRAVVLTPMFVLSIVVGFGWYAAVVLTVGDEAVGHWNASYVQRFLGHYHLKSHGALFYFYSIPWLALPWTISIVIGAKLLWRRAHSKSGRIDRFLWSWFISGFVLLTIAAFRSKHYAVPILPPLSVLAGMLANEHIRHVGKPAKRFYVAGFAITLAVYVTIGGYVMPKKDWRKPTIAFVREQVASIPDSATLYVAGLAQSAVYPYINRDFEYINNFADAKAAADDDDEGQPWILTYRRHLTEATSRGYRVREIAAEAPSATVPMKETLVFARLVSAPEPVDDAILAHRDVNRGASPMR